MQFVVEEKSDKIKETRKVSHKKRRIGIDCRMWDETGIGRYIRNVVSQIAKIDHENQYVLFLLPKNMDSQDFPSNFSKVPVDIRWHTFAEQTKLPFIFLSQKLDLLFVPHFNVPILYPKKFVASIHDLTILRVKTGRATTLPYPIYAIKRVAFRINILNTAIRAKNIFVVSNFVKEDLIKTFSLSSKKIIVAPCAASPIFSRANNKDSFGVLQKYNIKTPYLFYVGNAHPHKNLETLLMAFAKIIETHPDLFLVLGGKKEFFYERLEREVASTKIASNVIFPGFIEDADLPALYSSSLAFVTPSLYEGFGIQVLEAFACGTKVICSGVTSLPEVGGNAAFYFDPRNVEDIVAKVCAALDTPFNQEEARNQLKKFSWEISAQNILNQINKLL